MLKYSWLPKLAAVGLGCVVAGCGGSARQGQVRTTPPPPPPPITAEVKPVQAPAPPPVDPVQALIDDSQRLYEQGKRDLDLGHLEQARAAFNRAIDVLLSAPGGARTEPRLRAQFDRLVDRISALEVAALATGDGFAEKPTEPASLDQLLAMSDSMTETVPTRAVAATVETDLAETKHDIPIPQNEKVLAYVELFQGRLRPFIQDGLDRGGQYLPMIQNVFRAEGLPLDLAYVPLIESAFKTNALSVKSARGVWQFVHATALENGLRHDWYIDERSDPEKATKAAAKYLKTLSRIFDGDWHLALASYNGGPGRVQRAMKRTGRDDFWELSSNKRWLPRETREYVPMILAAMVIARNPAQYGFSFTPSSPMPRETVNVSGPLDLRRVAEWTGTPVDTIEQLNPELRRWTTPIRDDAYAVRVPAGTADVVKAKLADASTGDLASLRWYTVKRGDTLSTIARSLRVSRTDLAAANYMKVTERVEPGSKLIFPHESTVLMAARADRPVPATESRALVADAVVPAVNASEGQTVKVTYRVKRGDTLATIARAFGTNVSMLKTWNRIPGTHIAAGDRLTIYTAQAN